MISLTFPDGSVRQFEPGTSGRDVAGSIAKSLQKKAVAIMLDGALADLSDPIDADAEFKIITRDDADALELIRHDCAHVMAEAVQELWPGTQVTIGPVIENGFYYDFARNEPFTPEDLPVIEKKMREIISATSRSPRKSGRATRPTQFQGQWAKPTRSNWSTRSRRAGPEDLQAGRLVRSVPRPAHGVDRPDRQCLQADEGGRCLLARRQQQRDADAHLRHGLGQTTSDLDSLPARCWRKRKSATTASSAARWICSISRKKGPAWCSGIPRAGACFRPGQLHAPPPGCARL